MQRELIDGTKATSSPYWSYIVPMRLNPRWSEFERKINDIDSIRIKRDTTDCLDEMRGMMAKDNLDY